MEKSRHLPPGAATRHPKWMMAESMTEDRGLIS
jgi:hypothetical protein